MIKKSFFVAAILAVSFDVVYAGGMLTNTNQSISFLRNPARDAAIDIDGVYSNPAGVAFLDEGCYLSLGWQSASQKRIIKTTSKFLDKNLSGNPITKEYVGNAKAWFVPSLQFAKNKGPWSYQLNFAIVGGGGKAEFANGLGSFDAAVGQIGAMLQPFGGTGYDVNSYMQGKQYYLGLTLGAAYKVNKHLALYSGFRVLRGDANYEARINNITVKTSSGTMSFANFLNHTMTTTIPAMQAAINAIPDPVTKAQKQAELDAVKQSVSKLDVYKDGVNLHSDQKGWGVAPIIGINLNYDKVNFALKYEFKTNMSMKNRSTVKQALAISAVNTFIDGTRIREDSPALLTLGAQWKLRENTRFALGYHHYYDKAAKKTYAYTSPTGTPVVSHHKNSDFLRKGSYECLGGIEHDLNDRLTLSCGVQTTRYGLSDAYMSDISFVVDSWSLGLGAKYKLKEDVFIQLALFKTFYEDYKMADNSNTFTRKNSVIGLGYDYLF